MFCAGEEQNSKYILHVSINELIMYVSFEKNEDRTIISHVLLQNNRNEKLNRGIAKIVASLYSVSDGVIRRIWKRTRMIRISILLLISVMHLLLSCDAYVM